MKIISLSKADIDTKLFNEVISQCYDLDAILSKVNFAIMDVQIANLSSETSTSGSYGSKQLEDLLRKLNAASADLLTIDSRITATIPKIKLFKITDSTPVTNLIVVLNSLKKHYSIFKSDWVDQVSLLSKDDKYYGSALINSVEEVIARCESNMSKIDQEVSLLNLPSESGIPKLME